MSKIIIDEIEAKTTDIALTPNGTGNVEIQSELVDGTLQLNTSTQLNNVKIKTPPDSAGQSHTLILPDNDVDVDKFLKVKSVTGSGSTASGQLEYATIATTDTTSLNADDFTTGTVSNARMPTSFPNTSGFALKLIQKTTVTSGNNVASISFTGLDHDSQYIMLGKNVKFNGGEHINIAFLNSSGGVRGSGVGEYHERTAKWNESYYIYSGGTAGNNASYNYPGNQNHFKPRHYSGELGGFIMEFNTEQYMSAMHYRCAHSWYHVTNYSGCGEMWCSMTTNDRIEGIKLDTDSGSLFMDPTEIMLYKYVET